MSLTSINIPFRNVSYDILREIFFHCLPENPLDQVQPNTNIAPILLCHICSSWRMVALSSPSLWTHLYIRLSFLWDDDKEPIVRDREALRRDVDFMKWWRINHDSMAPFLRFNLHRWSWRAVELRPVTYLRLELDAEEFLFDYVSSAQDLDIDEELNEDFRGPHSLSYIRWTLVSHWDRLTDNDDPNDEYVYSVVVLPTLFPPTLRRLSIQDELIQKDYQSQLDNWSVLTHLSLNPVHLSLDVWFSLIRKLINLQWGDFSLSIFGKEIEPPQFTLSVLSTLTVSCHFDSGGFPLSTVFQNLQLPALRTLSLCSSASTWHDTRAIIEIHNVLKSSPAITKLVLGTCYGQTGFLCFRDDSCVPSVIGYTDKLLLMDAPHLMHLQIELLCTKPVDTGVLARRFVQEFFVSNHWLDLASPTNTIQTITVVVENKRDDIPDFDNIMKDLLMWNIKKYATTATNVSFEVASAADVATIGVYGSVWKTWGFKV